VVSAKRISGAHINSIHTQKEKHEMSLENVSTHSNRNIFIPRDTGSPHDGLMAHISNLGQMARLDFERYAVTGEVIYAIESDSYLISRQDEEARIGTLAYALKKLGNTQDAAEFIRCLNSICEDGDARSRQTTASYFYNEITERGTSEVLKDMALLAMRLASLNVVEEIIEPDDVEEMSNVPDSSAGFAPTDESHPESIRFFFDREIESIARMTRGRRKSACFVHDECSVWLSGLEEDGASIDELDDAFAHTEAMDQYDENGAIIMMSSHERTVACGRIDPEYSAEDLPERAQYLAKSLLQDYANGVEIDQIRDEINTEIEFIFPVAGRTGTGETYYSHANRELQRLTRHVLEAILDQCEQDFHLTALRNNRVYRHFHKAIRDADDTKIVGELMKEAYESRQSGSLPLKHFAALKAASILQRERLQSAHPSKTAYLLIREINSASQARLRYLSWAMYGENQPSHLVHSLTSQDRSKVWAYLNARKKNAPLSLEAKDGVMRVT
jgi:hypothetical protein